MRKWHFLPALVVVFLLGSTIQAAFHHHKDGKFHPECQICLFQQAAANGDAGSVQIVIFSPPAPVCPEYFTPKYHSFILAFPTVSRSPPIFS
ncbi:MAG: hypothetical protein GXO69_11640 [Acidobacteria bacterium]|nr:hypothetical protein [Acidobacteriota bacterium]